MIPFRTQRSDIVVGVFVMLAFLLLVVTAFFVVRERRIFETRVGYHTVFKESYGIAPGNSVTMVGMEVGRVTDVHFTEENQIRVQFNVLVSYVDRVRQDSVVEVQSPPGLGGIIGGTGLKISLGGRDKALLPPGGMVTGVDPMGIDEILAYFQDEQAGERGKDVLASIEHLVHSLGKPEGPVQSMLGDVAAVTSEVRNNTGRSAEVYAEILRALKLINRLLGGVGVRVADAGRILEDVQESTGHVKAALAGTPDTVAKVNLFLDGLAGLLVGVDRIVADLKVVSAQAGPLSQEVPTLLAQVDAQLKHLDEVMVGLRKSFLLRSLVEEPTAPTALDPGLSDSVGTEP